MNIKPQNNIINNVKNKFNRLIEGILIRYDNYIYYRQMERFYKNKRSVIEIIKDKVNLAIACLSKNISKYVVNSNLEGHPHSLFLDIDGKLLSGVKDGLLRRDERNSKK